MKEEVNTIEQLELIKSIVLHKDGLLFISGKSLIIWGIISIILFLSMPMFFIHLDYGSDMFFSTIFMVSFLGFAFFMSYLYTKKKNKKLERRFSKYQRMLKYLSFSCISLGILLSIILAKELYIFIGLVWVVLIGIVFMISGFFTKHILTQYGIFLLSSGILAILLIILTLDTLTQNFSSLQIYYFGALFASITLGLGEIILGIKFLKEERLNV
ncbi:MAG: hypothetical protein GY932_07625 [Arcobacter sp.]|nr:hypothetical protein [Arcobacter sp.]